MSSECKDVERALRAPSAHDYYDEPTSFKLRGVKR